MGVQFDHEVLAASWFDAVFCSESTSPTSSDEKFFNRRHLPRARQRWPREQQSVALVVSYTIMRGLEQSSNFNLLPISA